MNNIQIEIEEISGFVKGKDGRDYEVTLKEVTGLVDIQDRETYDVNDIKASGIYYGLRSDVNHEVRLTKIEELANVFDYKNLNVFLSTVNDRLVETAFEELDNPEPDREEF